MRIYLGAIVCAGLLSQTGFAAAQSLSDEEMLQRFMSQKAIMDTATELGSTRSLATRGLSIVTLGDEGGDATSVSVTSETERLVEPADAVAPSDPNKPLVAARFEPTLAVDVRIEFEFDSAAISSSQETALDQVCRVMSLARDIEHFRIIGHTDAQGSDEYNKRLSELRAQEVGRYLVNCGIDPGRLDMVGYGEEFLANPDQPDAANNRRVEFQALG